MTSGFISQDLFPTSGMVLAAAVEPYRDGALIGDLQVLLTRAAIEFLIGVSLGVTGAGL